jgi:uncharacterized cupin superfamily protein
MSIKVDRGRKLNEFQSWDTWSSKPNHFDWEYDQEEHCYIIEGEATIETDTQTITIEPGDYVIFPKALKCHWTVHQFLRKHYSLR